MRKSAIAAALIAFSAGALAAVTAAAGEAKKDILTEASVWRSHITWMPGVVRLDKGLTKIRYHKSLEQESDPPPPDWVRPDFDDSSWSYWRTPYHVETLKLKKGARGLRRDPDGDDTGVTLREPGQYGVARSAYIGMRCLRSRFRAEDPAKVGGLTLAVEFRGGIVVYLNGREVGRAYLPKDGPIEPGTLADDYPDEAFVNLKAEAKKAGKKVSIVGSIPLAPEIIKRLNTRIRQLEVDIPSEGLAQGINVLALEMHRTPCAMRGQRKPTMHLWGTCGLVSIALRGTGSIEPAVERPKGFHVWNANALQRITPFGFAYVGRQRYVGGGRFPASYGDPHAPIVPIRLVGARNSVCTGQIGISCDEPIRGLKAVASELVLKGGSDRIAGSAVQILYMKVPDEPCNKQMIRKPHVSFIDALYEQPPAEVAARAPGETGAWADMERTRKGVTTCIDTGAAAAVWVKVRVPSDAPAGEYHGTLTVTADGHDSVSAPVRLDVADWTAPDPKEWVSHVGTPHSVDTLSIWYKVPLWSEEHWRLVEKTLAFMGEIGAKDVYIPLRTKTWLQNEQSMVYWVRQSDGSLTRDYRIFDRYMDLAHKYLNPDVYCLYAAEFAKNEAAVEVSLLDPKSGKVTPEKGPAYEPTPDAIAFWKPLFDEITERLKKRGVRQEQIMLGMYWEGGGLDPRSDKPGQGKVDLFKKAMPPGMKLVHFAHYGGGRYTDIPFGYAMSVFGNRSGVKAEGFGARNLPFTIVKYYRVDTSIDLRPTAHRGALRQGVEQALETTRGTGPIGMDFWHLPADREKGRRRAGSLERVVSSTLTMSGNSTIALLAPGADGPISTARFETLREGLQECEARMIVELALADEAARGALGEALVKRCENIIKERKQAFRFVCAGGWPHAEGWKWFEGSGWEDRALDLFACAGEVARALKK